MTLNQLQTIDPKNRKAFRSWLRKNHRQASSVWVRVYKAHTSPDRLRTIDVVEECLCFGWVDSRPRKNDPDSFLLLISQRRPKSVWSAVNKKKVSSLAQRKLMTSYGLKKISQVKQDGGWDALSASDNLLIPDELKTALSENMVARNRFSKFSRSARRTILEWIYAAKTAVTRSRRIKKTVSMAAQGLKTPWAKAEVTSER